MLFFHLFVGAHIFGGRIVVGRSRWGRWRWKGGQWGFTTDQWEHHGMGVYQINHLMAIWWDIRCYIYIYTPLYTDLYTWVNKQLDGISCPRYPRLAILHFSRNSTEIRVYGCLWWIYLCTKNCTAGWFANGGKRQITTGGPLSCTPCFMRCIGLAVWRMNFVWHVHLQWSSQLKTIWFEVIETETSQDSHVIKWATDSTQYSIYTWQRFHWSRLSWPLSKNPDGHVHVHCHH